MSYLSKAGLETSTITLSTGIIMNAKAVMLMTMMKSVMRDVAAENHEECVSVENVNSKNKQSNH